MRDSMKTELNSWRRFIHSQIEKPVEYLDTHTYMKGRWDRCIDHLYNIKLSLKVVFAHQHHFCHLFPRSQTYYFKSRQIDVSISYARIQLGFLDIDSSTPKSIKTIFFFWISRFHFLRYHGRIKLIFFVLFQRAHLLIFVFDICPKNADSA